MKAPVGNRSWSSRTKRSTVIDGSVPFTLVTRRPWTGASMVTMSTVAFPPMARASNTRAATVSAKDSVDRMARFVRVVRQL